MKMKYEEAMGLIAARGLRVVETVRCKGGLRLQVVDPKGRPNTLNVKEVGNGNGNSKHGSD